MTQADDELAFLDELREAPEVPVEEPTNLDPFDAGANPVLVAQVQLIVQMRIYDALMAILTLTDEEAGNKLHELHATGGIMGALPSISLEN